MIAPTAIALSLFSSLSLALSPVEDPVRASLQAAADRSSYLVSLATIAVAVGVAFEMVEIIHAIVAWITRKRREKREAIELHELLTVFPTGEVRRETKLYSDDPRWMKLLLRVGIIIVVFGVVGEWVFGARLEDAHNALHTYDVAKLKEADEKAGKAAVSAEIAHGESDKAVSASSNALNLASGARKEADSFEKDIVSAKQKAADAESHLADALKQAALAEAELQRLKSPRSLINVSQLITTLSAFKGTQYTLTVFEDEESLQFLKEIDGVLQTAGWIRKQPESLPIGIPWIRVPGIKETFLACLSTGISLDVRSKDSLAALQSRPVRDLPRTMQAALALKSALDLDISPQDERNVAKGILDPEPGEETPVQICIGKKP